MDVILWVYVIFCKSCKEGGLFVAGVWLGIDDGLGF